MSVSLLQLETRLTCWRLKYHRTLAFGRILVPWSQRWLWRSSKNWLWCALAETVLPVSAAATAAQHLHLWRQCQFPQLFFSPAPFWDICYRLYLQNETWTGYTKGLPCSWIGLSVLPSKGGGRKPSSCTECPWQQHSSQNLALQPVRLKGKILVASFLIKLFL